MKQHIQHEIQSALHLHQALLTDETLHLQLQTIVLRSVQALQNNHKIWLCGNGGSAADAMHLAAELAGRFYQDRKPLPAEVLGTNFAFATAVANDYNYETVYTRALHAQARKGDLLWAFSTSGNSPNILQVLAAAQQMGLQTIGFSGLTGGNMHLHTDILIKIPSAEVARIQEAHLLVGHILCRHIENSLFPPTT